MNWKEFHQTICSEQELCLIDCCSRKPLSTVCSPSHDITRGNNNSNRLPDSGERPIRTFRVMRHWRKMELVSVQKHLILVLSMIWDQVAECRSRLLFVQLV